MSAEVMRAERAEVQAKVRALGNEGRANIIRRLLLEVSDQERVQILYKTAICRDCGDDRLGAATVDGDSDIRVCHCMNDE